MTRASMLALLREIEFAGWNHDGYDPSHGYCPSCGVDPESGLAFEPEKHGGDCKLAAAIAWLEDDGKREMFVPASVDDDSFTIRGSFEKGWVLR